MHTLTEKELKTLIKLEAEGKLTPDDLYRRLALKTLQNQDNYVGSAIAHIVVGCICVGLAGQMVAPVFLILWGYSWFKSYRTRLESIRRINAGEFIDYLEPSDRISYEKDFAGQTVQADATATEAPTESATEATPSDSQTVPPAVTVHPGNEAGGITPNVAGQKRGIPVVDLPLVMGKNLHPTIISARPRIGKGMVVSAAWRQAKKHHPDLTVWIIDPKPHPSERGYWQGVDRYWGLMIEGCPQNDEAVAAELTEFIFEWRAQGNRPTLLIVDELVKLEAILPKWYRDFLIPTLKVEASSGETDQRFLWCIAQSPQVRDLGLSGGSRAVFDFLTLQRADSIDHAERVRASINAIKSIPTADEFKSIPSGVAFWHSRANRWGGVPVLEVPQAVQVAAPSSPEKPGAAEPASSVVV